MGSMTDFQIARWQEMAGLKPASGETAEMWRELSKAAFELIRMIELERSGIRDGDGMWHGSSAVDHAMDDVVELCKRLHKVRDDEFRDRQPRGEAVW